MLKTDGKMRRRFCFDLDSTITKVETLPFLAEHFGISREMEELCRELKEKNLAYDEDLKLRLNLLKPFPISDIQELFLKIPLCGAILDFMRDNAAECAVITSNVDLYVSRLIKERIGCAFYASKGAETGGRLRGVEVVSKERVVKKLQAQRFNVIFTGDGRNDAEALRAADFGIAASYIRPAAKEAVLAADAEAITESQAVDMLRKVFYCNFCAVEI